MLICLHPSLNGGSNRSILPVRKARNRRGQEPSFVGWRFEVGIAMESDMKIKEALGARSALHAAWPASPPRRGVRNERRNGLQALVLGLYA
jgi:hypothetical protein